MNIAIVVIGDYSDSSTYTVAVTDEDLALLLYLSKHHGFTLVGWAPGEHWHAVDAEESEFGNVVGIDDLVDLQPGPGCSCGHCAPLVAVARAELIAKFRAQALAIVERCEQYSVSQKALGRASYYDRHIAAVRACLDKAGAVGG